MASNHDLAEVDSSKTMPAEENVEYDDVAKKNIKKLALALEDLDDNVIETVRDLVLVQDDLKLSISNADLTQLEGDRTIYLKSGYRVEDVFEYLNGISERKKLWLAMVRSLVKAWASGSAQSPFDWKFRIRAIEHAGGEAWRVAVPASHNLAFFDGKNLVNEIIDHLAVFDDFLDLVHSSSGEEQERERFASELNDTLHAIISINKTGGSYAPLTNENINAVKKGIRRQRRAEKLAATNHQRTEGNDPEHVDKATPSSAPSTKGKDSSQWNPALIVIISTFTLLASIFGSLGCTNSPHAPGTKHDADFWFLIQSCTMSILGLAAIIIPLIGNNNLAKQTRTAIWCLIVLSFSCIVASIPMYLALPTEWSAEVAFIGGALQSVVILVMISDRNTASGD